MQRWIPSQLSRGENVVEFREMEVSYHYKEIFYSACLM